MTPIDRELIPLPSIREVKPGSFIFARPNALPPSFCDEVIARFEAHPEQQHEGRIGQVQVLERRNHAEQRHNRQPHRQRVNVQHPMRFRFVDVGCRG